MLFEGIGHSFFGMVLQLLFAVSRLELLHFCFCSLSVEEVAGFDEQSSETRDEVW
jgi:hypothetical protein